MKYLSAMLAMAVIINLAAFAITGEGNAVTINKDKHVAFNYRLSVDGIVVDTLEGKAPFEYTHGENSIIPGLEQGLEGMKAGERKTIEVEPKQAYGEVNPAAFQEFPKSTLPAGLKPEVGMKLQLHAPDGRVMPVKITEVKEESVVMDTNHPLAGKTLVFDVEIISVK